MRFVSSFAAFPTPNFREPGAGENFIISLLTHHKYVKQVPREKRKTFFSIFLLRQRFYLLVFKHESVVRLLKQHAFI